MDFSEFVGRHVSRFLESDPFEAWPYERTVEDGLEEDIIQYAFHGHGLEIRCDSRERITSIFLYSSEFGGFDPALSGLSFSKDREGIRDLYGVPSAHGDGLQDPVLGEYGAWDRFDLGDYHLHFQYTLDGKAISMITLMTNDVVP